MVQNDSGEASAKQSEVEPTEDDDADALHLDVAFGILQNERRRRVLRYLRDNPTTTQGDLAEHVAAIENGVPPDSLTSTQRKRVYVSLYQSHLPKLDDVDAIEYDPDRGTVARTSVTDEFLSYLERAEESPDNPAVSKARHVLGAAALLAVALLATLVVGPDSPTDLVSVVAFVAVGFAGGLLVRGFRQ